MKISANTRAFDTFVRDMEAPPAPESLVHKAVQNYRHKQKVQEVINILSDNGADWDPNTLRYVANQIVKKLA